MAGVIKSCKIRAGTYQLRFTFFPVTLGLESYPLLPSNSHGYYKTPQRATTRPTEKGPFCQEVEAKGIPAKPGCFSSPFP